MEGEALHHTQLLAFLLLAEAEVAKCGSGQIGTGNGPRHGSDGDNLQLPIFRRQAGQTVPHHHPRARVEGGAGRRLAAETSSRSIWSRMLDAINQSRWECREVTGSLDHSQQRDSQSRPGRSPPSGSPFCPPRHPQDNESMHWQRRRGKQRPPPDAETATSVRKPPPCLP